jgi:cytochrome c oxidase subunit 2
VRRSSLVSLLLLTLFFAGIATAVALLFNWLPEPASREMGRIVFVYWMATIISIVVFAVVTALLVYSIWKFRTTADDDLDGPPTHGNTRLEIIWTAIPTLIVIALSVASAVALAQNDDIPDDAMQVEVTGQQFAWSFKYPDQGDITSGTLRLPLGRPVELRITALDVLHSFWVPDFGQKQDAVPGSMNPLKITPTKLGTFPVICTELCGLGHSVMRAESVVMKPEEFDAWVQEQRDAADAGGSEAGAAVFSENGCGGCHAFEPAGSQGNVGPPLDDLGARAEAAGKPLEEFVHESIVAPDEVVAPGFQANVMPKTYGQLPESQVDALVQYLTQSESEG